MGIKFAAETFKADLSPGVYEAQLSSVEQRDGDSGPYLLWTFEVKHGKKTVEVGCFSSLKFSPKAKARQFAEAILNRSLQTNEELDSDDLCGRDCQIIVSVDHLDDGGTRNTIEKVMPAKAQIDDNDVPG